LLQIYYISWNLNQISFSRAELENSWIFNPYRCYASWKAMPQIHTNTKTVFLAPGLLPAFGHGKGPGLRLPWKNTLNIFIYMPPFFEIFCDVARFHQKIYQLSKPSNIWATSKHEVPIHNQDPPFKDSVQGQNPLVRPSGQKTPEITN